MKATTFISLLLVAPYTIAIPTPTRTTLYGRAPPTRVMGAKSWVVTPSPCVAIDPAPSEEETEARFDEFADALISQRNLTKAFEYVSATYVNHNPVITGDGPDAALDGLSIFWNFTTLTPIRQMFVGDQGWINYQASGMGTIVDRFRFEAGCIVEHWDVGEVYPET